MWHSYQPISNITTATIAAEEMKKNTLNLMEREKQASSEFI